MALVPVKTQVFQSTIQHLLCIATASEIVILGFVLGEGSGPISNSKPGMHRLYRSFIIYCDMDEQNTLLNINFNF